jgi:hypothetical protein
MRPHAFAQPVRAVLGSCLLLSLSSPAFGLVKFNDGHDSIFVTGTVGMGYDTNIYANSNDVSDTTFNGSLDLDYLRKAGMLGVNGNLGWNFTKFDSHTTEDFADPHARLELTKGGGRTTGSLTLGAERRSRSEDALNLRTVSWDYNAGLNVKYPVIERYSIAGQVGYDYQDYLNDTSSFPSNSINDPALFSIRTYTASADLFYVYTSERDLLGGYRLRVTDTTNGTRSYDHAFTLGTTGKLLPKLNGTVRLGYQFRETDRGNLPLQAATPNTTNERFDAYTALASATWTVTKRLNVTGMASRDFSTLATDVNVDTTAVMLDANFAAKAKLSLFAGIGAGHIRYLGAASGGRTDTYDTAHVGVNYTLNDHLKVTLSSLYYKNWSLLKQADYDRRTISLIVSSRW